MRKLPTRFFLWLLFWIISNFQFNYTSKKNLKTKSSNRYLSYSNWALNSLNCDTLQNTYVCVATGCFCFELNSLYLLLISHHQPMIRRQFFIYIFFSGVKLKALPMTCSSQQFKISKNSNFKLVLHVSDMKCR